MLLGIVLHAALFLVPDAWPVLDKKASASLPYDDIVNVIHGFRMPVFFLLSGFFTAMLWQRRGLGGVLKQPCSASACRCSWAASPSSRSPRGCGSS